MRIYLGASLLVQSTEFHPSNHVDFAFSRILAGPKWDRDRSIYLWDLRGLVTARPDDPPINPSQGIEVTLSDYKSQGFDREFPSVPLEPPTKKIHLTGYHSSISHHLSSVMKIVRNLECSGVECLVHGCAAPMLSHVHYASKRIRKAIKRAGKLKPVAL
jgi:hypothetical protein